MPTVAALYTRPESVIDDYKRLLDLAGFTSAIPLGPEVIVKNNLSWHLMYPSANTTPWQLEAVLSYLSDHGYKKVSVVQNETVVTNARTGQRLNKFNGIYRKFGTRVLHNFNPADMRWTRYRPKAPMQVLDAIFPKGVHIPDYFIGKSVVHLPTIKCHIYTQMTGAMKNAFGGLLANHRHYCHSRIHETLADLLAIQKEIHPGLFAVTDGTTVGDGPGPRTMRPVVKNLILASADCVAIDAVAAKLLGFDPLREIGFVRFADARGLGVGDPANITLAGDSLKGESWGFRVGGNLASRVGNLLWFGPLKPLQRLTFHTPLVYIFIFASAFYHDRLWYPIFGRPRVRRWLKETAWGKLFAEYKE